MKARDGYYEIMAFKEKLTTDTYNGVVAGLPKLDTLNSGRAKKYIEGLEKLYTDKKGVLDILPWSRDDKKLKEHLLNYPEETPDQTYEWYKELVGPVVRSRWSRAWEWLSDIVVGDMSELGKATKGKSELREPKNVGEFEFEVQRISQSDKKAAKEYYDKWAGKW